MPITGTNKPAGRPLQNRVFQQMNNKAAAPVAAPASYAESERKDDRDVKVPSLSVLFGNELKEIPPELDASKAKIHLYGTDKNGNALKVPISEDLLSRHFMLLGGIGTGKSNAFFQIVHQLNDVLTEKDVMIIFDTKGDFLHEFGNDDKSVVISNDGTARGPDGKPDYWNIFNEIADDEQQYSSVMEISKSLFKEACEKTSQVFFPNAARDIFMAIMLFFLKDAKKRGENNFLSNKCLIDYINSRGSADIRKVLNSDPSTRAMISYISSDESPQTQGVLSELQQVVRNIFVGNFCREGSLGIKKLVREKKGRKIFIEYDLSYGETLTPIYSLMFDIAIKEALGRGKSDGNVYFITDEFRLLPNLVHIDDAVNFGRGMGIKFMIGIQNVEQIYDNYGEARANSILSGFLTSLNFRVNDPRSREFIKEKFGRNIKKATFISNNSQNKGLVEENRDGYVVDDWDMTHLNTGEAIIGFPGMDPFTFQFNLYPKLG